MSCNNSVKNALQIEIYDLFLGAIRDAGGAFSKKEKAHEDQYFRNLQKDQLDQLGSHFGDEIKHHEENIQRSKEAIKRLKEKSKSLNDAQK